MDEIGPSELDELLGAYRDSGEIDTHLDGGGIIDPLQEVEI